MRRTLGFVLLTVAAAVVQPSWNPSALAGNDPTADEKLTQSLGRLVFYFADYKREGSEGLYVIDPSTDEMTKVADAPSKNCLQFHYRSGND
jgi:hypothetical protein